jgi:Ca2+-binding EF-hand superfamily protein
LLDVDQQGYLTIETFKTIFEKLELGKIEKTDEDIFREVTNASEDGKIRLEDFRKILQYNEDTQD